MRPVKIRIELDGDVVEREFHRSPVQIGRNPKADLRLPYDVVSSWHALIRFDDAKASYFDLGSTNGSEKDGKRIGPGQEVAFGDQPVTVRIGDVQLTLQRTDGDSPPARAGTIDTGPEETVDGVSPGLQAMQARLQPLFERADAGRQAFEAALSQELAALPLAKREAVSTWAQHTFPLGSEVVAGGGGPGAAAVAAFAKQLLPPAAVPTTAERSGDLLRRVAEIMQVCAQGLVEMQEGQESISRQFGVKAVKHYTGLRFALSAEEALAYLLSDPDPKEHRRRLQELSAAFSDTMSHQIATINGVISGARALLAELEPGTIERGADPGRLTRFRDCWKTFVERWERLANGDGPLLAILFGPEFARVYTEVGGELSAAWQRSILNQDDEGSEHDAEGM